ncbi:MAG: 3-hydroxyacyl-CoA dehydrogenase [Rhodocyclaceae bacterium]|nr:3-hydroxyacyl-CoA dehydrogenase [Rhodocyclaceae bacterium]MBX3666892.1 3-hydroxyacyl-CoA dehydrogenase [Rhodocyclaceae bacterium]
MGAARIDADLLLGIAGCGVMGRSIAQIALQSGVRVRMYDARAGAAREAEAALAGYFERMVQRGRMAADAARACRERLQAVAELTELAPCTLIIEAITEQLDAKCALFAALEPLVAPNCVFASNTSSLSITTIASASRLHERLGGLHFFNPIAQSKLVEVVSGLHTSANTSDSLVAFGERLGLRAVRAKDAPGFIVNHAGRAYLTEALRCLDESIADYQTLDRILREGAGFRLGPFETLDQTGLDVAQGLTESIYRQFYEDPRLRPSQTAAQRVAAGLTGRKAGRGFYDYSVNASPLLEPEPPVPTELPSKVWVSLDDAYLGTACRELVLQLGGKLDPGLYPANDALCVVTPLGEDVTTCALRQRLPGPHTVALDMLFGPTKRRTLMASPATTPAMRRAAHGLFGADGVPVALIRDSAGFVAQRVVACIVNTASDIAQRGIAEPADIDDAVRLALGYPRGPLAWGDELGPMVVLRILENLQAVLGDPRYRPSPWLRRRARLGLSLLARED